MFDAFSVEQISKNVAHFQRAMNDPALTYGETIGYIVWASGYTKEIGIALGIDGDSPKLSPESVKPTLQAIASQTNYETAVVVGNRAQSDMWKVFMRRANSETRAEIASGTGKSADITISPTTGGQPEKVELTVQLYKKNEPYGQLSDPVYVTVSP